MAVSDQVGGPSPSDREGDTPEDPALFATASADAEGDFDSALLELAAAPSVAPRSRRVLRPEPGTVIADSYRIERQLGEGGMGIVFLARDLQLDRLVALKLQSRPAAANDLARLQREAKAMARLSHPNVVVVHEVGTHDGHVFIAMEYVEGGTAREWIDGRPDWRAVIEVLAGAGRGLAAAHEVGIVHRDLKPENVMLGREGRARVADFGLARDGPSVAEIPVGSSPLADGRLTATGAVLGTPAYMSPEQFAGGTVAPASDQFSFCVMAYEALFGKRPFVGKTMAEIATAVIEGDVASPPAGARVPVALTRAVLRGLRVDPSQRHPSMGALVDALEDVVRARRRRVWIGVAGGAAVVALGLGFRGALALQPQPCEAVEDALGGAWDETRRDAVAATNAALVGAIDEWAAAWIDERRIACEDTSVKGERSELELGLRMACLDRHAARLDGFTAGLAEASNAVAPEVVDTMLPALAECRDVTALEKLTNRFDRESSRENTEQDRARNEALRLVVQARTRLVTFSDGAEELLAEAEALAESNGLPDIEHIALTLRADLAVRAGDAAGADSLRARAIELAAESGEDAAVADAIRLRAEAAIGAGELAAARTHLQYFDVFVKRVVDVEARERTEIHAAAARGQLALAEGKPQEAIGWYEKVLARPELYDAFLAGRALGSAYLAAGRPKDAVAQLESALSIRREQRIENDPELAGGLVNLANVRMNLHDYDGAVDDLREAHEIATRASGDQRMLLGILLGSWGAAERRRGDLDRARALQEESLAVRTDLLGDAHPYRAYATDELGVLARLRGDYEAAQRWLEQSIALRRAAYGNDHGSVAESLSKLGEVHLDRGASADAREALTEALRIVEAAPEKDAEALAEVNGLLARTR